ncbi:hypothetical protein Zmor_008631 [Zophobas morio]|jgi:hypothetical protein|uniref:Uncharacterized protein n=1 Tax=Zophobas morio TaxID=2755281 RepID=A0AA38HIR7_9CUCU|nr:hypothetical protein Zmor_008631 [Zophobas morio]
MWALSLLLLLSGLVSIPAGKGHGITYFETDKANYETDMVTNANLKGVNAIYKEAAPRTYDNVGENFALKGGKETEVINFQTDKAIYSGLPAVSELYKKSGQLNRLTVPTAKLIGKEKDVYVLSEDKPAFKMTKIFELDKIADSMSNFNESQLGESKHLSNNIILKTKKQKVYSSDSKFSKVKDITDKSFKVSGNKNFTKLNKEVTENSALKPTDANGEVDDYATSNLRLHNFSKKNKRKSKGAQIPSSNFYAKKNAEGKLHTPNLQLNLPTNSGNVSALNLLANKNNSATLGKKFPSKEKDLMSSKKYEMKNNLSSGEILKLKVVDRKENHSLLLSRQTVVKENITNLKPNKVEHRSIINLSASGKLRVNVNQNLTAESVKPSATKPTYLSSKLAIAFGVSVGVIGAIVAIAVTLKKRSAGSLPLAKANQLPLAYGSENPLYRRHDIIVENSML